MGASVRARLLDRARAQQSDFQVLLTRYTLERLLYRMSVSSEHRDRFILKGAMLFSIWINTPFRPTRDLDLLGYGRSDVESIAEAFRAICAQPVADDGVQFDVAGLEAAPIREGLKYGGVRVRTTAVIDRARTSMLGFKSFRTAAITLAGIEPAHRIRKRQFSFGRGRQRRVWTLKQLWDRALA
jgi:hypothetical protein